MIELETIQKVIDQRTVVDIDLLSIGAGEITALVGPAGSGKGTLISLLTGRTRPTAGTVRFDGLDPYAERRELSQRVGVLFYEDSLYEHRSPLANLAFFSRLHGLPKSRAGEVLDQVGLADHANAKLNKLSSGLLRRLAFGRAILHEPSSLILVDPFARCDEASIGLLSDLITREAEAEVAVLILAEDDAYLSPLCDTIHLLTNGRIVESVRPQEEVEPRLPFKIPVRLEGRVALVNPADILYADAEEGRAYLQTTEDRLPTQFTLAELEERLSRSGFFRAHRGYLVNLQHVTEVIPFTRNSFSLRMDDPDGTLIPLSKSAASELRDLLGY
ncbi:MAG: ATP-binding cassette domain-containing protein [Anaerolineales bacterium]|nr:ATP-binding cassette domain-containing protein [Anaerolineales bacterium]